jgi:hypothetical protein
VTYIGNHAFSNNSNITSVTIPDSVNSISSYVFQNCTSLSSVIIGQNVRSIEYYTFSGCSSLKFIKSYAMSAPILESEGLPLNVVLYVQYGSTGYDSSAWGLLEKYYLPTPGVDYHYRLFGTEAYIECYTGTGTDITIPETLGGYPVTSIGCEAFKNCTYLKSVVIPNSVTSIGYGAFRNCTSLTSVSLPSSLYNISPDMFAYCTSLTNVNIPDSIREIDSGAFSNCSSLKSVHIPDNVYSMDGAFQNCTSLTEVNIPESMNCISRNVFYNCTSLTNIVIPSSVTSIGDNAFSYCTGLTSINIPSSVTSIGFGAFRYCSNLLSINLPNSVVTIKSEGGSSGTFDGCSSLTSITIPNGVTNIGREMFAGCTSLADVSIGSGVTNIGDTAFYYCTGLKNIYAYPVCAPIATSAAFIGVPSTVNLYKLNTATGYDAYPWSNFNKLSLTEIAPKGLTGTPPTTYGGNDGVITGTTTTMEYRSSSESNYIAVKGTEITGLQAGTYYVRYAAAGGFDAGEDAVVEIANGSRAIKGLTGVSPTIYGGNDGKVTGTTATMEYRRSTDVDYGAVTGTEITGLQAGTYYVRYAASDGYSAGTDAIVEIANGPVSVKLNGITPSQLITTTGKHEGITVSAIGSPDLIYQYYIYSYQTGAWSMVQSYSTNPTLSWTFDKPGRYQVMCFVKDKNSANYYDKVAYCETMVNSPVVTLNGMTPSQLTTTTGKQESITVSASGSADLMYQYHIYNYQTGAWSMVQGYSTNPTLSWAFDKPGRYQLMCFVKDKNSINSYDKVAYCETMVNSAAVTLNGMTPSQLTTTTGKQESITVSASGSADLMYQYHIYNYQTGAWSVVQGYSTNSTLSWAFDKPGRYQVMCFVKDKNSINSYDKVAYCETMVNSAAVTLNGITPSQLTTTTGKQESITVSASGSADLMYQYHIYNYQTGAWSVVQDYSSNSTLSWTFDKPGRYQVMCFVKDKNSINSYDKAAYCETMVNSPAVTLNGINPSQLTTTAGKQESITVDASESGGAGLVYQYHIYNYQTGGWSVVQGYSTNPTLSWTFDKPGRYQVMCFVKDKNSINSYDKVAYCETMVNSPIVTLNGITPNQLTTTTGKQESITVEASESGGAGLVYQYHIYNYQTGVWSVVQGYSTNPILSWTFDKPGRYQVMCFVKDKNSINSYDKVAYCETLVN